MFNRNETASKTDIKNIRAVGEERIPYAMIVYSCVAADLIEMIEEFGGQAPVYQPIHPARTDGSEGTSSQPRTVVEPADVGQRQNSQIEQFLAEDEPLADDEADTKPRLPISVTHETRIDDLLEDESDDDFLDGTLQLQDEEK